MMELLDGVPVFWILAVVVPVGLYLLGIPLLILATFRQEAFPTLEQLDPADPLPEAVRQYFFQAHEELAQLNFSNEGCFYLPQVSSNVKALFVLFANRHEKAGAMAVAIYAKATDKWELTSRHVEFSSKFTNGDEIDTGNEKAVGAFPTAENNLKTIHPELQNLSKLFSAHQSLVRHHRRGRNLHFRLDEEFGGDVAAYISSTMTTEFEHAKRIGYLKHSGGDQASFSKAMRDSPYRAPGSLDKPHYTATIKGAYLMTWKELWPFKSLLLKKRIARDRNLLAESGFDARS